MADIQKQDEELKHKSAEQEKTAKDPVERLRLKCLQRGAKGIKGLSRLVYVIMYTTHTSK